MMSNHVAWSFPCPVGVPTSILPYLTVNDPPRTLEYATEGVDHDESRTLARMTTGIRDIIRSHHHRSLFITTKTVTPSVW